MINHQVNKGEGSVLSKNDKKIATNWYEEIRLTLDKTIQKPESAPLKALLEKYSRTNSDLLKSVINMEDVKSSPLSFACYRCSVAVEMGQTDALPALKANVLLLLEHGANPNIPTYSPISLLYKDLFKEFVFGDLILAMINSGLDLKKEHRCGMTIAHFAAAVDRKREILPKILELAPDLLHCKDEIGEQPLMSAIRHNNPAGALEILKHNVDINARNNQNLNPLGAAIFFKNPIVARSLMMMGAEFSDTAKMIIYEAENEAEAKRTSQLIHVLAKAGYYIHFKKCKNHYSAIEKYCNIKKSEVDTFLLMLEDVNTGNKEAISNIATLEKSTTKISPEFNHRIHQSFHETLKSLINTDNTTYTKILEAYNLFSTKYPNEKFGHRFSENTKNVAETSVITDKPSSTENSLEYISEILRTAILGSKKTGTPPPYPYLYSQIKKIINYSIDKDYPQQRLLDLIKEYYEISREFVLSVTNGNQTSIELACFSDASCYQFIQGVTVRYINNAKSEHELNEAHEEFLFLFIKSAFHLSKNHDKSIDMILNHLNSITEKYKELKVDAKKMNDIAMLSRIFQIRMYSDGHFFSELTSILSEIQEMKLFTAKPFASKKLNMTEQNNNQWFISTLDAYLNLAVNQARESQPELLIHSSFILQAKALADILELPFTLTSCNEHMNTLFAIYKSKLTENESATVNAIPDNLLKLEFDSPFLRIVLDVNASKTKARNLFKDIDAILHDSKGYYIPIIGMNIEEIQSIITTIERPGKNVLMKATAEPESSSSNQPAQLPDAASIEQKYAAPASFSAASSSSSTRHKVTYQKQKGKLKPPEVAAQELIQKKESIQNEIALAHHVSKDDVFPVDYPYLSKDKQFHFWAIWGEIECDKNLEDGIIIEHRKTAEAGRFCGNKGEQGLKITKVVLLSGESAWSIKTKRLGVHGDARIVATPKDFRSESLNDNIKVYKFGRVTFHK